MIANEGTLELQSIFEQNHVFSTHSEPVFEESGVQGKTSQKLLLYTCVPKTYQILQTYMYGVPKLFTPPDTRCASGIEDRHNFHFTHFKHSFQLQSTHTAATRSMYTRRYAHVHTQALVHSGR